MVGGRASGDVAGFGLLALGPGDFPPVACPRPADLRQSPVVGPDGDPRPPGVCLRGTRAGHRILLRYQTPHDSVPSRTERVAYSPCCGLKSILNSLGPTFVIP